MGRVVTQVKLVNPMNKECHIEFSGMVDTGAAYVTLPKAWKHHLGELMKTEEVKLETATQDVVVGDIGGPVLITIEGFRPFFSEVLFIDMHPEDGMYEPLVGYLPLEQCQAAVDMVGHRLIHVKYIDLK